MSPKSIFVVHAMIQTLSIILLSIGLYYALARPDQWFKNHRMYMFLFVIFITIGTLLALYSVEFVRKQKSSQLGMIHGVLGIVTLCLIFVQIMWAIVVRKHVSSETYLKVHRALAIAIIVMIFIVVVLGIVNLMKMIRA
jgi:hypothetical protein